MKYAHYDKETGKIIGWYDSEIHVKEVKELVTKKQETTDETGNIIVKDVEVEKITYIPNIPEPNIEVSEEQWQEAIDNGYNYVDVKNKTLSRKDFRTEEEKMNDSKKNKINYLKQVRDKLVNEIVVTLETEEQLDGNELAQTRMSRAIQALPDDTTELNWIDATNNTIKLTKPKFSEALVLAGQRQTEIYVKYNELRTKVESAATVKEINTITWNE